MRFIADCMLGKLAKWLVILGFDVTYFRKVEDSRLLSLAKTEGRTLLTRDIGMIEKAKGINSLFINSESWKQQVEQVLNAFDLWHCVKPYSRCIECNLPLKTLTKEKARNLVASFVYEHSESFSICPGCGRVFWKGTHYQDMDFKVDDILKKKKRRRKS